MLATAAADIGTWDWDVRTNVLRSCSRSTEMLGTSLDNAGWYEEFLERVHAEDRASVHHVIQAALQPDGTGKYDMEFRVLLPKGELRWIAAKGKAFFEVYGGERKAVRFLGTLLDRTEHKKGQDALVQSEKLTLAGRLAASIAHEIRNPLDAISNLFYLMRQESSASKRSEYLTLAEAELGRLSEIASNTLRSYRDPSGAVTIDIGALIDSVLAVFQGRMTALQVRVQREFPPGVVLQAPPGEVRQVLMNLIGNALDAMPKGGQLILRVRQVTGPDRNRYVCLTIADTGQGMSRAVVPRIFDAFYTTKGGYGTGIGLWLSQEILKKYASKIRVKSSPGRGTVFSFDLPAARPGN